MGTRRSNLEVTADLLKISRGGKLKTHIIYGTNLNWPVFSRYMKMLIERGLIVIRGTMYFTTEKGEKFIDGYDSLVLKGWTMK